MFGTLGVRKVCITPQAACLRRPQGTGHKTVSTWAPGHWPGTPGLTLVPDAEQTIGTGNAVRGKKKKIQQFEDQLKTLREKHETSKTVGGILSEE